MITEDDAQRRVQHFATFSLEEAATFCRAINEELEYTKNGPMVVVDFGELGYGLMLKIARDTLREIGAI